LASLLKDEHIETLKQAMRLLEDKRVAAAPDQADQVGQVEAMAAKAASLEKELNQALRHRNCPGFWRPSAARDSLQGYLKGRQFPFSVIL